MKKKIISLLMAFILCLMPFGVVFAEDSSYDGGGGGATGTNASGYPDFSKIDVPTTGLEGTVGAILGIIKWIAYAVAIVMVMYVGIKYLTAGAGVKAEAKSTLVPMLIGAVLVALAPTVVEWIFGALG